MIDPNARLEGKYCASLVMSLVLRMAKRLAGPKAVTEFSTCRAKDTWTILEYLHGMCSSQVRWIPICRLLTLPNPSP